MTSPVPRTVSAGVARSRTRTSTFLKKREMERLRQSVLREHARTPSAAISRVKVRSPACSSLGRCRELSPGVHRGVRNEQVEREAEGSDGGGAVDREAVRQGGDHAAG